MDGWTVGRSESCCREADSALRHLSQANHPRVKDINGAAALRLTFHHCPSLPLILSSLFTANTDKKPIHTLTLFICLFSYVFSSSPLNQKVELSAGTLFNDSPSNHCETECSRYFNSSLKTGWDCERESLK